MAHVINNIQFLRAVAAISVVYIHATTLLENISFTKYLSIGGSGVDIFFVISGFIMVYSQRNNKTLREFYLGRCIRIMPVYYLILIFLILMKIQPLFPIHDPISLSNILMSFLFISHFNGDFPLLVVGATLEYEMLFYVIFGFALYKFKNPLTIFLFVSSVIIILTTIFIDYVILEFIFGMFIAYTYKKFHLSNTHAILLIIIGFIILHITSVYPYFYFEMGDWVRVLYFGLPSFLIVLGCLFCKQIQNRTLLYLGSASYSIYLTHTVLYQIWKKIIQVFAIQINIPQQLYFIILVFTALILGCMVYSFLEKPLTQYLRAKFILKKS